MWRRSLHYLPWAVLLVALIAWMRLERSGSWDFWDVVAPPREPQASVPEPRETLAGRVAYVFDGDTLSFETDDHVWRVRLVGIDAPEHDQPYGRRAREFLAELCDQQWVQIRISGRDSYDRLLADVYRDDVWINGQMVESGYAWQWSRGQQAARLGGLQQEARRARRGLWAEPRPLAPWNHRRQQREAAAAPER